MSDLMNFLIENPINDLTEEVVVSARLAKYPFTIKAMSGNEFSEYQKLATTIGRHKKVEFSSKKYNELVIINHTTTPNFKDADSVKKAGCITPEQFMYKSLLAGEIAELSNKISMLSGFDQDMEDTIEEAKN